MSCKSVLIVEDDQAVRQMIQDVLEIEGYQVFSACDGNEGIDCLKRLKSPPCVILLDLMMPGANGWKFLDVQRTDSSFGKIPVIVCSAYKESAKTVRPDAIVQKPVKLEALLNAVQQFCA